MDSLIINVAVPLLHARAASRGDTFASQALVELRRDYCEKRKCIYCRFGRQLLSKSIASSPAEPAATNPALPF